MYNSTTPEQFVSALADENRAFFSDSKGRGALRFLDQAFPHNWIYLAELLQNAIDEGARAVSMQIVGDTLVFEHDGNAFSADNVKGLCSAGLSTKGVGTVGFMGVGFKSVFHSFESVSIASGPWQFRLHATWHTSDSHYQERIRDWLGTVIPIWDDTISPPTDGMTCRFIFSDRVSGLPPVEQDLDKVLQDNLSLLPLLSRKGIQRLHWNGTTWHLTARQGDALVEDVIPLTITARSTNDTAEPPALSWLLLSKRYRPSGEAIKNFLEHRQKEPPADPEARKEFYHQAERFREVEAFVELAEEGVPRNPTAGQAFAVLPMDIDLPVGLHIQADWLLVVTRAEPKQPDNAWHSEIKQQIPSLIAGYLDWLVSESRPSGWYRGYEVMPNFQTETRDDKWLLDENFRAKLRVLLLDLPFLPTLAPETFATPRESRFLTASFSSLLEPRFKPELLFGKRIVNSPCLSERAKHSLQALGLLHFLQPADVEPFWSRGGIAKWYERLDRDFRNIGLIRLLASLKRLEDQPQESILWAEFDFPCVLTESGGWVSRRQLHRLPGDWQVLNQIQGIQSALKTLVVADSTLLSWSLWMQTTHPIKGEERSSRAAHEYLQSIPEESLESLTERWWNSLPIKVDTDMLDLVIRFTRWVKEKQPSRWVLIRKLVADDPSGKALLLPVDETLLSAPYAEAFRDIFYPDTPRVSRDYLYGGNASPVEFRLWHDFFRSMKPSPGGLFSLKANTEEWTSTPQNQKTLANRLKFQPRDLRRRVTYIPPKMDPFGNAVKYDHYYLTDFRLDPRWPSDTTLEHRVALAAAKWLHEYCQELPERKCTTLSLVPYSCSYVEVRLSRIAANWVEQLREQAWVPVRDQTAVLRPADTLASYDPNRPDASVANLPQDLVDALTESGIEFGANIPEAPVLLKLEGQGPTASLGKLLELLQTAISESVADETIREQLLDLLDRKPLLPASPENADGKRAIYSRFVVRAGRGPNRRGDLGGWIIPLEQFPAGSPSRNILDCVHRNFPFPETTSGKQALDFLTDAWQREPERDTVRNAMRTAYDYLCADLDGNAELKQVWVRPNKGT